MAQSNHEDEYGFRGDQVANAQPNHKLQGRVPKRVADCASSRQGALGVIAKVAQVLVHRDRHY